MSDFTRRSFLKSAALATGLAAVATQKVVAQTKDTAAAATDTTGTMRANVAGSDVIRVGVIGAGGRGTGAAIDCIKSSPGVQIVAIGDAFMDRAEECLKKLQEKHPENCTATKETLFDGFDCYDKVINAGVDLVILASPPGFRPTQLRAAVEADKHVFAEKPVAVDPVGVRHVLETYEMAKTKGLAIVAGTQRRHSKIYLETMQRVKDGAIGELVGGQFYWVQEGLWVKEKQPEWSDMEWQMRNWLYFDWTSGDIIVEQHLHNIDVMNWAMGGPPEKCIASGGRLVRDEPKYGNVYDHFDVEFEYANGVRTTSMCRQWEGGTRRVSERLVGTNGTADPNGIINGPEAWKFEGDYDMKDAYVQEHTDLIKSIRDGKPLNELKQVAESCLTAIMARTAAYTGQAVSFKWAMNASKLDLTPEKMEFGPHEINPVPKAGVTKLV